MNFTKICRSSGQCPISQSDEDAIINFTLTSENFCATISIDIGLFGTIQTYSDSTFTTLQSSFIVGQRACYLVILNSDSNPQPYNPKTASIILSSTLLTSVTVRVNGDIDRIFSSANSTSEFDTSLQTYPQSQGNEIGFCFTFSEALITDLNCTGVVTVVVGAEVTVNYQGGTSTNGTKRSILSSGTDSTALDSSSTLTVTTYHSNNEGGVIFVSLLLAFLVLFF